MRFTRLENATNLRDSCSVAWFLRRVSRYANKLWLMHVKEQTVIWRVFVASLGLLKTFLLLFVVYSCRYMQLCDSWQAGVKFGWKTNVTQILFPLVSVFVSLPRPCWNCIFSSSGSCLALIYPQCLKKKCEAELWRCCINLLSKHKVTLVLPTQRRKYSLYCYRTCAEIHIISIPECTLHYLQYLICGISRKLPHCVQPITMRNVPLFPHTPILHIKQVSGGKKTHKTLQILFCSCQ